MFGIKRDQMGELSVGKIISVVILIVVGLLLLPLVQDLVVSASENATSESAGTLIDMVTIFYVLGIVLSAVMWVVYETRDM